MMGNSRRRTVGRRVCLVAAVVAGAVMVGGCGSESPDQPEPAPTGPPSPTGTSEMGTTVRDGSVDLVDAHLAPASGHRTRLQVTLANTDPDRHHDLLKVTGGGHRATITGPDSGDPPGRLPLPPATHVDTLAGRYRITFPSGTFGTSGIGQVTLDFAANPATTVSLPITRH